MNQSEAVLYTSLLETIGEWIFKHRNDVKLSLLGEICGDITQMLCQLNISFLTKFCFCV